MKFLQAAPAGFRPRTRAEYIALQLSRYLGEPARLRTLSDIAERHSVPSIARALRRIPATTIDPCAEFVRLLDH